MPAPEVQPKEGNVNVVGSCGGWRTPEESWLDMKAAEDEETFFVNMVTGKVDKNEEEKSVLEPQEEYEA
jgi:hypothetical protein